MTSNPTYPSETLNHNDESPFWRGWLDTTLSYFKWGYGTLLLSFVAYGLYVSYKWLEAWSSARGAFGSQTLLMAGLLLGITCRQLYLWRKLALRRRLAELNLNDGDLRVREILQFDSLSVADLKELVTLLEEMDLAQAEKPLVIQLSQVLILLKQRKATNLRPRSAD